MAAPIVSGTAALLMSQRLRLNAGDTRNRLLMRVATINGTSYGMGTGAVAPERAVGRLPAAEQPEYLGVDTGIPSRWATPSGPKDPESSPDFDAFCRPRLPP